MLFDVSAPELGVRELAPEAGARRAFTAIGGTTVAFMQFVGASSTQSEVCVADAAVPDAPAVCLTDDGLLSNRDPAVSPDGSTVAWAKCQDRTAPAATSGSSARVAGVWGTPLQLTDSTGEDILPATDGEIVTYASNAGRRLRHLVGGRRRHRRAPARPDRRARQHRDQPERLPGRDQLRARAARVDERRPLPVPAGLRRPEPADRHPGASTRRSTRSRSARPTSCASRGRPRTASSPGTTTSTPCGPTSARRPVPSTRPACSTTRRRPTGWAAPRR